MYACIEIEYAMHRFSNTNYENYIVIKDKNVQFSMNNNIALLRIPRIACV